MKTTSSNLKRLSPKDFNATLLEELTRQGRVFIAPARLIDKDAYKREVLDYVQRIADYAADDWQENIAGLWQQIVEAPCFRECLTMKNKYFKSSGSYELSHDARTLLRQLLKGV